LPILLLLGVIGLFLDGMLRKRQRSVLSALTLIVGSVGVLMVGVELLVDRYVQGEWSPGGSRVVLTICLAVLIPLVVVRRVPSLREEARRRFHM
ncbi:MAG: zinc ribbon domain-containing protein, partial [Lawsonibacter sp.]